MEITVKKEIEQKVEITLPAYYKSSCHYIKIIEEKKVLVVGSSANTESINLYWFIPFNFENLEQITEDVFYGMYNNVKYKFDQL